MTAALVLASRNAHKLRELAALLRPRELEPLPPAVELPPESGATFADNAVAKARAAALATGRPAVADDSGIEAVALGGRPGLRSARYAGERATDEENLEKLLREVPPEGDTRVAYVCALAYAAPAGGGDAGAVGPEAAGAGPDRDAGPADGAHAGETAETLVVHVVTARCQGELTHEPRGEGGFGYDPAFVPDEAGGRTMAELSLAEKGAISHRGRAARALLDWLDHGATA